MVFSKFLRNFKTHLTFLHCFLWIQVDGFLSLILVVVMNFVQYSSSDFEKNWLFGSFKENFDLISSFIFQKFYGFGE